MWDEYQARRAEHGFDPEAVQAAAENSDRLGAKVVEQGIGGLRGAVGTPDQIREYLRRYEECGVDQVIFCFQAGNNRHEHIMEALELFGREVLPEFAERDEKLAARQGAAARAGARRGDGAQARVAITRRCRPPTTRSRRSRARWPTAPGSDDFQKMLDDFAEKAAGGARGDVRQLAAVLKRGERLSPAGATRRAGTRRCCSAARATARRRTTRRPSSFSVMQNHRPLALFVTSSTSCLSCASTPTTPAAAWSSGA